MERSLSDTLEILIGDVPVSEQLGAALNRMAPKDHIHENYITRSEFNDLRRAVENLVDLVGDIPVSEQIATILKQTSF